MTDFAQFKLSSSFLYQNEENFQGYYYQSTTTWVFRDNELKTKIIRFRKNWNNKRMQWLQVCKKTKIYFFKIYVTV